MSCLHLVFCTLFGISVLKITRSVPAALCTVIIFAGYRPDFLYPCLFQPLDIGSVAPSTFSTAFWKDQPSLLADCATMSALILVQNKRWLPALAMTVIGVLFKESCWATYGLVLIYLLLAGELKNMPKYVYFATLGAVAIPIVMRSAAGMGMIGGEHMGSNEHWIVRYSSAVSGTYIADLTHSSWAAGFGGVLAYLAIRWKWRAPIVLLLLLCCLMLCISEVVALFDNIPLAVGFACVVDPRPTTILYRVLSACYSVDRNTITTERSCKASRRFCCIVFRGRPTLCCSISGWNKGSSSVLRLSERRRRDVLAGSLPSREIVWHSVDCSSGR